jgi:hypothetical protein
LVAVFSADGIGVALLSSLPPPTQALSMPTAGVASRPTAAARRSTVRRSSSELVPKISDIVVSSGEKL